MKKQLNIKCSILIVWLLITIPTVKTCGQTVVVTDSLLLARNPALAAARAEVEARRADVQTSALWDNPTLDLEQNVYNRLNGRWFDLGKQSEQVVVIQQPLPNRGRQHRITAAQSDVLRAEAALEQQERGLLLALHQTAIDLWYNDEARKLFEMSQSLLSSLSSGMEQLATMGEVSDVEVLRVKALHSTLLRDVSELTTKCEEARRAAASLIAESNWSQVQVSLELLCVDSNVLEMRLAYADIANRPDVKQAQAEVDGAQHRQRAADLEATFPQVALTASYDRAGNFIENYFAVGASLSLPLWNRGQGARRAARSQSVASKLLYDATCREAEISIQASVARLRRAERCLRNMPQIPEGMIESVANAYARRDIGLVEFLDHFEGLREAAMLALELKRDLLLAREDLFFQL